MTMMVQHEEDRFFCLDDDDDYDIESSFHALDSDHDGSISIDEFLILYWGLGYQNPIHMNVETLQSEIRQVQNRNRNRNRQRLRQHHEMITKTTTTNTTPSNTHEKSQGMDSLDLRTSDDIEPNRISLCVVRAVLADVRSVTKQYASTSCFIFH
jgi:hypothetical protein